MEALLPVEPHLSPFSPAHPRYHFLEQVIWFGLPTTSALELFRTALILTDSPDSEVRRVRYQHYQDTHV